MKSQVAHAVVVAMLMAACAPIPPPSVLGEVDAVRQGAAAQDAKKYAPGAFAHAEKLREEARVAFEQGDRAGAQMLGERALAAFSHAHVLSRVAHAEEAGAEASKLLEAAGKELSQIEAEQARVAAELDAIDMKHKVAREAQPIAPSGKADPEREKARLAAARALVLQARTLCAAARLLGDGEAGGATAPAADVQATGTAGATPSLAARLDEASAGVDKLDAALSGSPAVVPIDEASRVRARCLDVLTARRRAATPVTKAPGRGDELLSAIAAAGGWAPSRDDRGVVVTLRGLFGNGGTLTPAGEKQLQELARFAVAYPDFPIAAVLHADKEPTSQEQAAWKSRAEKVVTVLRAARVQRVETVLAGARSPLADPRGPARGRNARLEFVFVSPQIL
ncbi:hypothetical protein [Chondromyces crocatus]|uniref:Exported alanine-rich protein n=1 Tax=Chondromyces crocatus TaxID=52 RepID=A0A0K1EBF4_CHOCO|nr:hypothetical protein [Chondromyces crocatus]AKT38012.1 exported alanine-rich protein [Chondromyces crocatus]